MLTRRLTGAITASGGGRRGYVLLQSERPCEKLSDKVIRGTAPSEFYKHPSYVMSREKMLNTLWLDIGVFKYSVYVLVPYFFYSTVLKA